jgi:hypothetical protein
VPALPVPGITSAFDVADATGVEEEAPTFQLGDFVAWRGRLCVLRGIDPMSVPERRAELEECASGERRRAPLAELSTAPDLAR